MINNRFHLSRIQYILKQVLNRPLWVLIICIVLLLFNVMFDGTLSRLMNLVRSQKVLKSRIKDLERKNALVEDRLKKLSDSEFLEKEAKDRFNLIGEEDIVFIFSDENTDDSSIHNKTGKRAGETY